MKILETLSQAKIIDILNGNSNGIFPYIFTDISDEKISKDLSNGYYLFHSGEKQISPYFEKVIDFTTNNTNVTLSYDEIVGNYLRSMFYDKWSRVKSALLNSEYNPIENYNISEKKTADNTKTNTYNSQNNKTANNSDNTTYDVNIEDNGDTGSHEVTTRNSTQQNDIYGFNSSVAVGDDISTTDSTVTITGDKNLNTNHNINTKTGTENKAFSVDEQNSKTGSDTESDNIDESIIKTGRTDSAAELIQKELDLRDKNILFDIIYKDIDSVIALQIY